MAMTLPVGSLLFIDVSTNSTPSWQKLTEHNRDPVALSTDRIEQTQRMANGALRKIFIADKKNISVNWRMLPSYSTLTVDGGWGAEDMREFYSGDIGKKTFKFKISYNGVSARDEVITASISSFSSTIVKRNVKGKSTDAPQEFWEVSLSLDEV